ncbi:hypothetical protein DFH27DRAFT_574267 [Peziza echinospora]|nr:hypothetical protein DFH27DRAFT_574267 [Peziza echinospora]
MDAQVIILSSPPPSRADDEDSLPSWPPSRQVPRVPGTPPKSRPRNDIWCIPTSSSPLKSPNELLRSIMPISGTSRAGRGLGKGFKTARDMLEESEAGEVCSNAGGTRHEEASQAEGRALETKQPGPTVQTKAKPKPKPKAKSTTSTTKRARTANQTKTVSAHFPKKGKSVTESSNSKSVSPVGVSESWTARNIKDEPSKIVSAIERDGNNEKLPLPDRTSTLEVQIPAVPPRRFDWTPVKNSNTPIVLDSSPTISPDGGNASPAHAENTLIGAFGKVIGSFHYKENLSKAGTTIAKPSAPLIGTTKRCIKVLEKPNGTRLVSTVSTESDDTASNPPLKKGKKKAQTITDLATAKFRTADNTNSAESSIDVSAVEAPPVKKTRAPRKPKETVATKAPAKRKRATKATKNIEPEATLLSPGSAINRVNQQEVVFGSLSQLAKDDDDTQLSSPLAPASGGSNSWAYTSQNPRLADLATIRSHHNSQHNDIDLEFEAFEELLASDTEPNTPLNNRPQRRKVLWDASSRDAHGGLMDIEVIDLSKTPKTIEALSQSDTFGFEKEVEDERTNIEIQPEGPVDTDSFPHSYQIPDSLPRKRAKSQSPCAAEERSNTVTQPKTSDKPGSDASCDDLEVPDFEGCTTAELAQNVAKFGFKPLKKREKMIALLEECWRSQHTQKLNQKSELFDKIAPSIKRKGKGKEAPQNIEKLPSTFNNAEEIDTELVGAKLTQSRTSKATAIPGSPKRKRKLGVEKEDKLLPSPEPIKKRNTTRSVSPTLTKRAGRKRSRSPLHKQAPPVNEIDAKIFEAILAEKNKKTEQSWRYKMLMYEPIVIEDFTVWLNVEGLGLVGVDDEVSPEVVKSWAEQRGVANVWKETNKGLERSRF